MKHILIGINFSEQSKELIPFALHLAHSFSATLLFIHVIDKDSRAYERITYAEDGAERKAAYDQYSTAKEQELMDIIKPFHEQVLHPISFNILVQYGYTHEVIYETVKDQAVDLIVVGKSSKLFSYFNAGTVDELIDFSPCPLLILPKGTTYPAFKHIAYAADFILEDCESLLFLQSWLSVFQAKLTCFHLSTPKEDMENAYKKMSILERLFSQKNIAFRIEKGLIKQGMEQFIAREQLDMITLTHQDQNFWDYLFHRSTSKSIAMNLTIPIIIFQQ